MKWIAFLVGSMFAVNAFAVTTKNCPNRLTVSYEKTKLNVSLKDLKKQLDLEEAQDEEVQAIEKAYTLVEKLGEVTRKFDLESAKNGRCVYRLPGDDSVEKVELYSTHGKHILLLQTKLGVEVVTRGILARVYARIETLSKSEVELKDVKVGLALAIPRYPYTSYEAGGDLKFIGKVKDLDVTVE